MEEKGDRRGEGVADKVWERWGRDERNEVFRVLGALVSFSEDPTQIA